MICRCTRNSFLSKLNTRYYPVVIIHSLHAALSIVMIVCVLCCLQVEHDDCMYSDPTLGDPIMIPTASDDPLSPLSSFCNLYSAPDSFSNSPLQNGGSRY